MSDPFEMESLPDELAGLVAAERGRPALPEASLAQLSARVGAALAAVPVGVPQVGANAAPAASSGAAPATSVGLKAKAIALFAVGALAGGAGGAAIHARLAAAPSQPIVAESTPSAVAPQPAPQQKEIAPAPVPVAVVAAPPAVAPHKRAPAPHEVAPLPVPAAADVAEQDRALEREQALLEVARTALGRGNAADAMQALTRHVEEFPSGRLVEERESLRIQALAALGRRPEAIDLFKAFSKRFPHSLFLPAMQALLEDASGAGKTEK